MFLKEKIGERTRNAKKQQQKCIYWILDFTKVKLKVVRGQTWQSLQRVKSIYNVAISTTMQQKEKPSLAANWPHIQSHLNQFTCLHLRLSLQPEACGAPEPRWAKPVRLLPAACCYSPRRQASRCWGRRGRRRRSKSGCGSSTQRCNWDAYSVFPWK